MADGAGKLENALLLIEGGQKLYCWFNPKEYTILELAEAVLEVTGSSSPIEFLPLPVDDPMQRKPDITLAQSLVSWKPEVDLHSGLARTAEWFRHA